MHVGVIQHISDPEGFRAADASAMVEGPPEGLSRPIRSTTPDQRTGICIWHAESVEAVRAFVERAVGVYATNEYYELNVEVDRHHLGSGEPQIAG
jgi:hypothetical protein